MTFMLPQPVQPEPVEQSTAPDVLAVLNQLAALAVTGHRNDQLARQQTQELIMKVSELSNRIDVLISTAMTIKSTADAPAPVQEDDPEVAELGARIDEAIAVLTGAKNSTTGNASGFPGAADPNAPIG